MGLNSLSLIKFPLSSGGSGSLVTQNSNSITFSGSGTTMNPLIANAVTPTYYGTLYNKSSFSNLNDFSINGATASISGSTITLSGGSSSTDITHSLDFNYYTLLDEFVVETTFTVGAITSTSWGIGIGMRSANTASSLSVCGSIDLTNTATAGKLEIITSNVGSATLSAGALSFSQGDTIYLRLERKFGIFTLTAYNETTKANNLEISYSFTSCTSTSGTGALPDMFCNTGKFAIFSKGGTQNVYSFKVSSNTNIDADYAIIGDSKSVGVGANSYTTAFAGILSSYAKVINLSGSSDRTTEVLLRQSEIIALKPKNILLTIGRNDLNADGSVPASLQTNYANLVSAFQGAGINVIVVGPFYETTIQQATWASYLSSTYPSLYLDTYTSTAALGNQGVYDGIHPNQVSYDLITTTIKSNSKFNSTYQNRDFTYSNKLGQRTMIPIYDLNNRFVYSSLLTFSQTNTQLAIGSLLLTTAVSTTFNTISLNGQGGSAVNFVGGTSTNSLFITRPTGGDIVFRENNTTQEMTIKAGGHVSVGPSDPSALFHITFASTGAAGTAPLKLTAGTLLGTPETGAFEFDGTHLYFTIGSTRTTLI